MHNVGAVDVLESTQDLVQEVLDVVDRQRLRGVDDAVQVSLHEVLDDVYVVELLRPSGRRDDVQDADHVLVVEPLHQANLAQDPLRIDGIFEDTGNLLDRHLVARLLVLRTHHHPERTVTHGLDQGKPLRHLEMRARGRAERVVR